jgi:hypothetical protein
MLLQVAAYHFSIDATKTIAEQVALFMSRNPAMKRGTVIYSTFAGYESADVRFTDVIDGVAHHITDRFIIVNPRVQYKLTTVVDARYPLSSASKITQEQFFKSFALR